MARLLLLRHGQSTWNAEGRWQGWADPPLSDLGQAQALALTPALGQAALDAVVSSDLRRARQTADAVAEGLGITVEVEAGLRERDVGHWSGLTAAEIERQWPSELAAWRAGRLERPPGGESDADLADRAFDVLERLARRREGRLLVVTHGGLLGVVERRLGLERGRTANLGGRWVALAGTSLSAADCFVIPETDSGAGARPSLVGDSPRGE